MPSDPEPEEKQKKYSAELSAMLFLFPLSHLQGKFPLKYFLRPTDIGSQPPIPSLQTHRGLKPGPQFIF